MANQQDVIRFDGVEGSGIIDASPGNLNGESASPAGGATLKRLAVSGLFLFDDPSRRARAAAILRRLPPLRGAPVRIQGARGLRDRSGPVHAGSFLRERRIAFDCTRDEFPRIFVHEVAHFVWLRLGNPARWSYERVLRAEFAAGVTGELGWSAEWRKRALSPRARRARSVAWREYCCESFCDTAAWLWSGIRRHAEFTLPAGPRAARARWFARTLGRGPLSI
ncbi:MAG: hypothetical protein JST11_05760 [Acidobacteria bacterium]|nr:hypothetical protein [Acidobacteriota bacterium]